MNNPSLSIQDAARFLGVSATTLRRWEEKKVLVPLRTAGNQRRYSQEQLQNFKNNPLPVAATVTPLLVPSAPSSVPEEPFVSHTEPKPNVQVSSPAPVQFNAATGFQMPKFQGPRKPNFVPLASVFAASVVLLIGFLFAAGYVPAWGANLNKFGAGLSQSDTSSQPQVLAANDKKPLLALQVYIPSVFGKKASFLDSVAVKKGLTVNGLSVLTGGVKTENASIDAGSGQLTASNVIYSLVAGANVTIGGDPQRPIISAGIDTPLVSSLQGLTGALSFVEGGGIGLDGLTITNTGVLTVQGESGAVEFEEGAGIVIDGLTITNSDPGSAQKIFGTFDIDGTEITAGSNTDTFTFAAGSGIILTPNTTGKSLTISTNSSGATQWTTTGSDIYYNLGNVGIGNTAPARRLDVTGTGRFTGALTLANLGAGIVKADVNGLLTSSALNLAGGATELTGVLPVVNGGTGLASTPSNGQLLIGNGTNYSLGNLTGTVNQIGVSNGAGSIMLSTPQDIHTGASPTFASLNLTNATNQIILSSGNTGTISMDALTTNRTYTLPDASGTFCLTSGNCSGGGGGGISGSGTTNYIAKFTSSSGISDSSIFDNGRVGIGTTSPEGLLTVSGGPAGKALAVFNYTGSGQDILTASASGTTRLVLTNSGNLNIIGGAYQISGTDVLTSTTLGSGVVNSSLTSVGALNAGSITTGFGNIDVGADSIAGGDITATGTTGFTASGNGADLTFSGTGNHDITASAGILRFGAATLTGAITGNAQSITGLNNLSASGTITFGGFGTGVVQSNGSGVLSSAALNLAGGSSLVTGTLPTTNGGTGLASYNTGDMLYASAGNTLAALPIGAEGQVLAVSGAGIPSWISTGSLNYWQRVAGTLSPINITDDLLVGGVSTSSAKFQIFGNTGNATTSGTLTFNTAGNVQTTNNQTLTLGGSSTGNIVLSPSNGSGTVSVNGGLNLSTSNAYSINGTSVLNATTLGSGILNSSLTSVGALANGSIASGFGTIATANTITGTTLNGTTGINTGAGAGTTRITNTGNLTNIGTTQFNGVTYTWPGVDGSSDYVLTTDSSGGLTWKNVTSVGGAGDITAIGDVTAGAAFTAGGTQGTSLYFYDIDGRGQLTTSNLTQARTYTLPNEDGTICLTSGNCAGSGGGITGTGTSGQIAYFNGAGSITSEANGFSWDATNNKLGIGTDTPSGKLTISGAAVGKALAVLDETGDQDILTASASGTTMLVLSRTGNLAIEGQLSDLSQTALTVNDSLNLTTGNSLQINSTSVLNATTLGTGVISSSLTSVGALNSGSIANGFGSILTSNTIQGSDITATGTTGFTASGNGAGLTFSGSGNHIVSASSGVLQFGAATLTGAITGNSQSITGLNNFSAAGTITFGGLSTGIVKSNGSGVLSSSAVDLASADVTGTLTVNKGGTGNASFLANGVVYGNGSSALSVTSAPTGGQVLIGNASGVPTFMSLTGGVTVSNTGVTSISLSSSSDTATTSSNSGLEFTTANGLSLIRGCATDEILKWDDTNKVWECSTDAGGSGTPGIINVENNDAGVGSNVDTIDFSTDFSVTASPSNEANITIADDIINFTELADSLVLDASTSIATANFDLTLGTNAGNGGIIVAPNAGGRAALIVDKQGATGDILTASSSGVTRLTLSNTGNLNIVGGSFQIGGTTVLSSTTLGSGVTASSLTSVGALNSGSITSGFGSIDTGTDAISGGDITAVGTTGFTSSGNGAGLTFSGTGNHDISASAGTLRLATPTLTGTVTMSGFTTNGGLLYTNGSGTVAQTAAGSSGECLQSNGGGSPVWGSCAAGSVNFWDLTNGALTPKNSTLDLLVGGTSTASAKFAVTNMTGSGTPTASVSAIANGGAYITATGTLATTNRQSLTLGSATTGNIVLNGFGAGALQANASGVLSSGTLPVANGGTGNTTFLTNGVVYGNGSSALSVTSAPTGGQVLLGNGSGVPTFTTVSGGVTLSNTGVATIVLSSSGETATSSSNSGLEFATANGLSLLRGCSDTQILKWNDTTDLWECSADAGGGGGSPGVITVENNEVAIGADVTTIDFNTDFAVSASPSTEANVSIADDILDFTEFADSLGLDAATTVALSNFNLTLGTNAGNGGVLVAPKAGGNAALIVNKQSADGDIFAASASGTTRFVISNAGDVTAGGNGTFQGTTGLTLSGSGADFAFTGGGTNVISSTGTLQLNAFTLGGAVTGGGNNITGLGQLTVDNLRMDGNTFDATSGDLTIAAAGGDIIFTDGNTLNIGGASDVAYNIIGDNTTGNSIVDSDDDLFIEGNLEVEGAVRLDNSSITLGNAAFTNCSALETVSGVVTCGTDDVGSAGTNYWQLNNGAISPFSNTLDLLVGSTSSSSAEFAILNVNNGTPTASVSAIATGNGISLAGDGVIQTFRNNTLTLGGATTGNILIDEIVDLGSAANGIRVDTAGVISDLNGNIVLNDVVDIGSATTGLNITTAGALSDIDGSLSLNDNTSITGTLDVSSTLTLSAYTTNGGLLYTNGTGTVTQTAAGTSAQCLLGGTTPTWGTCSLGQNLWQQNSGTVSPFSNSLDLLVGGTSTASAKFAFINSIGGGVPTASIAGTTTNVATFITGNGTIGTTNNQTLTIGGTTTGNIILAPNTSGGVGIGTTAPIADLHIQQVFADRAGLIVKGIDAGLLSQPSIQYLRSDNSEAYRYHDEIAQHQFYGGSTFWGTPAMSIKTIEGGARGLVIMGNSVATQSADLFQVVNSDESRKYFAINPSATSATATISGQTLHAALVVDNSGTGDLFTASKSGKTHFVIKNDGSSNIMNNNKLNFYTDSGATLKGYVGQESSSSDLAVISKTASSWLRLGAASGGAIGFWTDGNADVNTTPQALLNSAGRLSIGAGSSAVLASLDVRSTSYALPVATFSGLTGKATLQVDNSGVGDLFTASKSGATKFTIMNNGNVRINNLASCDTIDTDANGVLSCGSDAGSVAQNYWQLNSGAVSPFSDTLDLLVGGTSSSSAKFAVLNVIGGGTPTASISAGITGAAFLTGAGNLQTTNNQTLTLGGSTTGNIVLDETVDIGSATTGVRVDTAGNISDINANLVLNDTTDIGSATTGLNVTTTGVLSDIDGNVVIGDTVDLGSATTGVNVTTAGVVSDIDGNLVLGDIVDIGSTTTGVRIDTAGVISDLNANLILDDIVDIGSATTGLNVTTAGLLSDTDGNVIIGDVVDLGSGTTGINITTAGVVSDIDGNLILGDTVDIGSTANGVRIDTAGVISDINANLVLDDTVDIGSATTGVNITTAGVLSDIDGNLVLGDTTDIGSAANGVRIDTSGNILDVDANLVLNDTVDIGSATTGLNVTTAGAISDIDGSLSLNDNTSVTGTLGVSSTLTLSAYTTNGGLLYTNASGTVAQTGAGTATQCLLGGTTPTWGTCALGQNYWQQNSGTVSPFSNTLDLLVGGTSTASAKFAVTNMTGSGTPTASISATSTGNGISLAGDATIESLRRNTLTIGGSTTGNITLSPIGGSGTVLSTGDLNLSSGKGYQLNGTTVLSGVTLGATITASSLDSVDALNAGSITSGFGSIDVGTDAISGGDITASGTTGLTLSGASSDIAFTGGGTNILSSTGTLQINAFTMGGAITGGGNNITGLGQLTVDNLRMDGNTFEATTLDLTINAAGGDVIFTDATTLNIGGNASDVAYNVIGDSTGTANGTNMTSDDDLYVEGNVEIDGTLYVTATNAGGSAGVTIGTASCVTTNNGIVIGSAVCEDGLDTWTGSPSTGVVHTSNNTMDVLVGSTASSSAEFAILNMTGSGTPTASVSAVTTGNGVSFAGNGVIQSFRNNTLTLGGNTTGNILIDEIVDLGSATTGIRIDTAGAISDLNGNIVLNDGVDLGSVANGINITTAGVISDNNGNISLNDNTDITGTLGVSSTLTLSAYVTNGGLLYANGSGTVAQTGAGTAVQCLLGGTTPTWGTCALGQNYWQQNSGTVSPFSNTLDLLVGGTSTSSAKFAVTNMTGSGTPTASISATTTGNGLSFAGDGTIQSLRKSTLTIGGNTTGNIILSANTDGGVGIGTVAPIADMHIQQIIQSRAGLLVKGFDGGLLDQPVIQYLRSDNSEAYRYHDEINQHQFYGGQAFWGTAAMAVKTVDNNARALVIMGNSVSGQVSDLLQVTNSDETRKYFAISPSGTLATATISAQTSHAGLLVDNNGVGDLFTASKSGKTHFTIKNSGQVIIGNTTDGITFDAATGAQYYGTARATRKITLSPEYPGAVLTASGSAATNGLMTSDASTSASLNFRQYYEWSSSQASLQDYTVAVRVTLPPDFSAWATSNAIDITYNTELTTSNRNELDVLLFLESVAGPVSYRQNNVSATQKTWTTLTIDDSDLTDGTGWDGANETGVFYLKMASMDNNYVQLGDIVLNYVSNK